MGNVKRICQTSWDFSVTFIKQSNKIVWDTSKILLCARINPIQTTGANGVAPELPQNNTCL